MSKWGWTDSKSIVIEYINEVWDEMRSDDDDSQPKTFTMKEARQFISQLIWKLLCESKFETWNLWNQINYDKWSSKCFVLERSWFLCCHYERDLFRLYFKRFRVIQKTLIKPVFPGTCMPEVHIGISLFWSVVLIDNFLIFLKFAACAFL